MKVTNGFIHSVHLCYSYTLLNNGRFFGSLVGTPFVSMSGYHAGVDYDSKSARVVKEDRQHLSARFVVYFKYYLLAKPIDLGSATYEFNIIHDIAVRPRIDSINRL